MPETPQLLADISKYLGSEILYSYIENGKNSHPPYSHGILSSYNREGQAVIIRPVEYTGLGYIDIFFGIPFTRKVLDRDRVFNLTCREPWLAFMSIYRPDTDYKIKKGNIERWIKKGLISTTSSQNRLFMLVLIDLSQEPFVHPENFLVACQEKKRMKGYKIDGEEDEKLFTK